MRSFHITVAALLLLVTGCGTDYFADTIPIYHDAYQDESTKGSKADNELIYQEAYLSKSSSDDVYDFYSSLKIDGLKASSDPTKRLITFDKLDANGDVPIRYSVLITRSPSEGSMLVIQRLGPIRQEQYKCRTPDLTGFAPFGRSPVSRGVRRWLI